MKALRVSVLLSAACVASCTHAGEDLGDQKLPTPIVHTQGRGIPQQADLYVIERSGDSRRLVDSAGINNYATWSPDGRQIAFQGNRGRPTEVYVINADGTGERNISDSPEFDEHPVWSPTGSHVLFESTRNGEIDLWVADTAGRNLFDLSPYPLRDHEAAWSRTGGRIAYVGRRSGNDEIYVTDAAGQAHTNITQTANQSERVPSWSPDGQTIAFIENRQLHLIQADGSNRRQITFLLDSLENSPPQWSPDGIHILVESRGSDIYRIGADGTSVVNLTANLAVESHARWSPDGNFIAFESTRTGGIVQVFIMRRDGLGVRQLTISPNGSAMPEWAPR